MTIVEFWNQAYLAALVRLPAHKAKKEADLATEICMIHWQEDYHRFAPQYLTRWKDQSIDRVADIIQPNLSATPKNS